jgi:hypothetical protein
MLQPIDSYTYYQVPLTAVSILPTRVAMLQLPVSDFDLDNGNGNAARQSTVDGEFICQLMLHHATAVPKSGRTSGMGK